jgi:hypothetical protein
LALLGFFRKSSFKITNCLRVDLGLIPLLQNKEACRVRATTELFRQVAAALMVMLGAVLEFGAVGGVECPSGDGRLLRSVPFERSALMVFQARSRTQSRSGRGRSPR